MKSMPLVGQTAPSSWWWCLWGHLCLFVWSHNLLYVDEYNKISLRWGYRRYVVAHPHVHHTLQHQFLLCPSSKIYVPSVNPARHWNHTINLFIGWTLCLYDFNAGCGWLMALCRDNITPCPIGAKKIALVGYFHLIQAPFGAVTAKEHHPHAPSWSGVMAGAAQTPRIWLLSLRRRQRCQCDA